MPPKVASKVILALGSNIGERLVNLYKALEVITPYVNVTLCSPVYETDPLYVMDQPLFLNAVVMGTTLLEPLDLLRVLKHSENEIGRISNYRYGPRIIDIDIIFYENKIIETNELTIPHPHIAERAFVLYPLADIAPDWLHPQKGVTVQEMRACISSEGIVCLGNIL